METAIFRLLKVYPGPPDLAVSVISDRRIIFGGPLEGGPDSTLVTVNVQNRFSSFSVPVAVEDGSWPVFGSDVRGVLVSVSLTNGLYQVGNFALPAGFQAAISLDKRNIFFLGGALAAGSSIDLNFHVAGEDHCFYTGFVVAEADPYTTVTEVDKANNRASAAINVLSFC